MGELADHQWAKEKMAMYQEMIPPVYGTLYEEYLYSPKCFIPESDRLDQACLEVHLSRLGNGMLLRKGYPVAIFNRRCYPLDPQDYSRCAQCEKEEILIPATFANQYFGDDILLGEEGDVNLVALCQEHKIPLWYDAQTGLICVTPPGVAPISRENDSAFLARMAKVFDDPLLPRPVYNCSEQSRVVVAEAGFPQGDYDWMQKQYTNLYSPTLLIRWENDRKVIYIAHENAVGVGWKELRTETVLLRSDDDGITWRQTARWDNIRWAYLFEVQDSLYLCGSRMHPSHALMIARVEGNTVRQTVFPGREDLTNPNACVVHNGRIWIPTFPCVMSADVGSDLLDPASWQFSNSLEEVVPKEWFLRVSGCAYANDYWGLEGNIIVSPDGRLHNMLRLEIQPNNAYAALLDISADGKTLTRNSACDGLVEMPTTVSKFCVRYDPSTKLYLAMTSYPTLPTPVLCKGAPMAGQRNILALVASPDLVRWKMLDILLTEREVMNAFCSARRHAFQYVVWDFDGEDLLYVVREASGYTKHYHDGKYVTLYRLKNYRGFVLERYRRCQFYRNPYHRQHKSPESDN